MTSRYVQIRCGVCFANFTTLLDNGQLFGQKEWNEFMKLHKQIHGLSLSHFNTVGLVEIAQ